MKLILEIGYLLCLTTKMRALFSYTSDYCTSSIHTTISYFHILNVDIMLETMDVILTECTLTNVKRTITKINK